MLCLVVEIWCVIDYIMKLWYNKLNQIGDFEKVEDKNFAIETVLKQYTGNESKIIIPDGVTEIGEKAFYRNNKITSVVFPKGLRHIGKYAFDSCSELSEVVFPESLITIDTCAFSQCEKITHIHIPKNVKHIEHTAFQCYPDLRVITADEENETFHALDNCLIETATNTLVLGGIVSKIPTGVTKIGKGAFSGRDIETLTIPTSVCSIGTFAFNLCNNKFTDVFIPASVTEIGEFAFVWCGSKKGVSFTIHAPKGSYAESYAKENNIPFVVI